MIYRACDRQKSQRDDAFNGFYQSVFIKPLLFYIHTRISDIINHEDYCLFTMLYVHKYLLNLHK